MTTVQFEFYEVVNGWKIISATTDGMYYLAYNEETGEQLGFYTHAGTGHNYFNPSEVVRNGRHYTAWRYLQKYIDVVRELSAVLFFRYQDAVKKEEEEEQQQQKHTITLEESTMQKPMIYTGNVPAQKAMNDFELRGIYQYLNESIPEWLGDDAVADVELRFGCAYNETSIKCTNNPSAEWLMGYGELEEYHISEIWLSDNNVLFATIGHTDNESLEMVVRIN